MDERNKRGPDKRQQEKEIIRNRFRLISQITIAVSIVTVFIGNIIPKKTVTFEVYTPTAEEMASVDDTPQIPEEIYTSAPDTSAVPSVPAPVPPVTEPPETAPPENSLPEIFPSDSDAPAVTEVTTISSIPYVPRSDIPQTVPSQSDVQTAPPLTIPVQTVPAQTEAAGSLININQADSALLQTLNGIGEVKAQAIIDYRSANGGFSTVDELINVKGIGEKTLEKIRPFVTV